ncbi:MAG: hypothetical protein CMH60_03205 [Myxococcales bacterium]|nr:hypothetical protein [Myxococcales bacterium]
MLVAELLFTFLLSTAPLEGNHTPPSTGDAPALWDMSEVTFEQREGRFVFLHGVYARATADTLAFWGWPMAPGQSWWIHPQPAPEVSKTLLQAEGEGSDKRYPVVWLESQERLGALTGLIKLKLDNLDYLKTLEQNRDYRILKVFRHQGLVLVLPLTPVELPEALPFFRASPAVQRAELDVLLDFSQPN